MLGDLTPDLLTPRTPLGCLASLHKQPTTHLFRVFVIFKMSFTHDYIWILEGEPRSHLSREVRSWGMGTKATDFKGQETPCPLWHILSFSV
jgi:hypothetical protein